MGVIDVSIWLFPLGFFVRLFGFLTCMRELECVPLAFSLLPRRPFPFLPIVPFISLPLYCNCCHVDPLLWDHTVASLPSHIRIIYWRCSYLRRIVSPSTPSFLRVRNQQRERRDNGRDIDIGKFRQIHPSCEKDRHEHAPSIRHCCSYIPSFCAFPQSNSLSPHHHPRPIPRRIQFPIFMQIQSISNYINTIVHDIDTWRLCEHMWLWIYDHRRNWI